jgi:hypothetical protein
MECGEPPPASVHTPVSVSIGTPTTTRREWPGTVTRMGAARSSSIGAQNLRSIFLARVGHIVPAWNEVQQGVDRALWRHDQEAS